jgi:1-acyl-sn-glycerol-3-phosphate acyltransferase
VCASRWPVMDEARVIPLRSDEAVPSGPERSIAAVPHLPAEPARDPPSPLERRIASGLAFLRRRLTGEYEVDEFGFDAELTDEVLLPAFRPLFERWFRAEVIGIHNVPREGGALLVGNHAGALWALDSVMCALAVHDRHSAHRHLRLLGADLVFTTPVLGELARKSGATLACNDDAERLLGAGELVGVFPEGFKGIGKPFRERYKLQRFGRGGFVTAALATGAPIVPVSIVGSEEIHPMLGNARTLARVLNLPYFPITPTFPWLGPLGLVPLPSKWYLEFGEPVRTDGYGPDAVDDPALLFELTDRIRETIQNTLYRLLVQRRSVWR